MRRREFITMLGGAAAWPLDARAQQADGVRRIGVLMAYPESDPEGQAWVAAFREGLQKLGWAENRNMRIDYRWAIPDDADSIQRFAKELVALKPDLILAQSTPIVESLLQQTRTIPIIFANLADPVGSGFVASLPRPGGNVPKRASALPEVPSMAEAGVPEFDTSLWFGLMAPAGTPQLAIEKIAGAAEKVMHGPEATENLKKQGFDPLGEGPDAFGRYVRSEITRWSEVARLAGVKS